MGWLEQSLALYLAKLKAELAAEGAWRAGAISLAAPICVRNNQVTDNEPQR
jgi:hypothetical protein